MQEKVDVYSANLADGVSVNKEVRFMYGTQEQYDKLSDGYTWGELTNVNVSYVVKDGDSWESIAGIYSIPVIVLRSRNKNIEELSNGIVLLISPVHLQLYILL